MRTGLISIPSRNGGNHYLKLFYQELEKYEFEVYDQLGFSMQDLIKQYGRINVLHFHFYPVPEENVFIGYLKTFYFSAKLALIKLMGIKIVWTAHNLLPHDIKYHRLQYIRRWVLVHMSDVIIVHFERAKDILSAMFKVSKFKMICMHHGTYEGCYPNSVNPDSARAALDIPQDTTVFLFFGNIRPYKNIESLIKAFNEAASNNPRIMLLLVGSTQNESYIQDLLELTEGCSQIRTFFKFIPDAEAQNYFKVADCCIFPYINIFTSGAALLALTFSKPIIMRKCEFTDEYFLTENGIFLEETDTYSIKAAIECFFHKKEYFKVTQEISNRYKWENIISKEFVNQFWKLLCRE